jgi:translation elongation factor EF-4
MEVFHQRLEQEHGAEVIVTAPTVSYRVVPPGYDSQGGAAEGRSGSGAMPGDDDDDDRASSARDQNLLEPVGADVVVIKSAAEFDEKGDKGPRHGWTVHEPMIEATVIVPDRYLGKVMELFALHRGIQHSLEFWHERGDEADLVVIYQLPLAEVIGTHFHDKIKAATSGFASFDYVECGYQVAPIHKLELMLNGEPVDALSSLVHAQQSQAIGKRLVSKLQETIPRQLFDIAIQARCQGKILARSTVKALRKNVTAKCYGGDITRRKKLLDKQKKGQSDTTCTTVLPA